MTDVASNIFSDNSRPQLSQANMTTPRVAVIIPSRNGHATIRRTLDSVFNQTYRPLEVIVVIDHDQNDPEDLIKYNNLKTLVTSAYNEYMHDKSGATLSDLPDLAFKTMAGGKQGPGIARNLGVDSATTSEYIAFIDDDDVWNDPESLSKRVEYLLANPALQAVGASEIEFINEQGEHIRYIKQPIDATQAFKQMLWRNPLITSSVVMRKDIFIKEKGFKKMYLAEDYDLWLRIGKDGKSIVNAPGAKICYTVRQNSTSHSRKREMAITQFKLTLAYGKYYPNRFFATLKSIARMIKDY